MKFNKLLSILGILFLPVLLIAQSGNDELDTGLPGDHFSLEGALELFKKATSPENFEELLNKEENNVNNLDLNEDGEIDYIRVIDNMDGDVHAIVLQVPISEKESQDIAVIEIERQGEEEAILQIIGDVDVYGEEMIVEPFEAESNDDGRGPHITVDRIVVNVFFWPSVRFIYHPGYRVYVSPFRWRYYPVWWSPWRPHPLSVYRTRTVVYRPHYRVTTTHRVVKAHKVYTPKRRTTTVVRTRTVTHKAAPKNAGVKKSTTTTTVKGKNGNTVTRKNTTTAVGAKNNKGKVGAKRTTTTTKARGNSGGTVTKKKQTTTRKKRKN